MKGITRTILTPIISGKKNGEPFQQVLHGSSLQNAMSLLPLLDGEDKYVTEMYVKYEVPLSKFYEVAEVVAIIDKETKEIETKKKLDAIHRKRGNDADNAREFDGLPFPGVVSSKFIEDVEHFVSDDVDKVPEASS